eukprot:ctg_433.g250
MGSFGGLLMPVELGVTGFNTIWAMIWAIVISAKVTKSRPEKVNAVLGFAWVDFGLLLICVVMAAAMDRRDKSESSGGDTGADAGGEAEPAEATPVFRQAPSRDPPPAEMSPRHGAVAIPDAHRAPAVPGVAAAARQLPVAVLGVLHAATARRWRAGHGHHSRQHTVHRLVVSGGIGRDGVGPGDGADDPTEQRLFRHVAGADHHRESSGHAVPAAADSAVFVLEFSPQELQELLQETESPAASDAAAGKRASRGVESSEGDSSDAVVAGKRVLRSEEFVRGAYADAEDVEAQPSTSGRAALRAESWGGPLPHLPPGQRDGPARHAGVRGHGQAADVGVRILRLRHCGLHAAGVRGGGGRTRAFAGAGTGRCVDRMVRGIHHVFRIPQHWPGAAERKHGAGAISGGPLVPVRCADHSGQYRSAHRFVWFGVAGTPLLQGQVGVHVSAAARPPLHHVSVLGRADAGARPDADSAQCRAIRGFSGAQFGSVVTAGGQLRGQSGVSGPLPDDMHTQCRLFLPAGQSAIASGHCGLCERLRHPLRIDQRLRQRRAVGWCEQRGLLSERRVQHLLEADYHRHHDRRSQPIVPANARRRHPVHLRPGDVLGDARVADGARAALARAEAAAVQVGVGRRAPAVPERATATGQRERGALSRVVCILPESIHHQAAAASARESASPAVERRSPPAAVAVNSMRPVRHQADGEALHIRYEVREAMGRSSGAPHRRGLGETEHGATSGTHSSSLLLGALHGWLAGPVSKWRGGAVATRNAEKDTEDAVASAVRAEHRATSGVGALSPPAWKPSKSSGSSLHFRRYFVRPELSEGTPTHESPPAHRCSVDAVHRLSTSAPPPPP